MISFRYHIVSIVAVFFALAIGVVLGSGPLAGVAADRSGADSGAGESARAELEQKVAQQQRNLDFVDEFSTTLAPTIVGSRLRGRTITLVVLPTARQREVDALQTTLGTAGAAVGGTVTVGRKLIDVSGRQLVDALGKRLEPEARDVRVPPDANPYERLGALVARAVGSKRRGGQPPDRPGTTIVSGMEAAGLLSADGPLRRRGDLVLLVAGAGEGSEEQRRGSGTVVADLAQAIDAGTGGAVLVGPAESAREGGQVRALREDASAARTVSTVDTVEQTAGRVVAVLALAGQAAGQAGHYGGADAADGAVPGAREGG